MDSLQFVLVDTSAALVEEWQHAFSQHVPDSIRAKFSMVQSKLDELAPPTSLFDCIVSPANSYGLLDGGFDYFLSKELAPPDDLKAATRIAQSTLYRQWKGYAPPGTCTLVPLKGTPCESNSHKCSFIALCPTMRIPGNAEWNREIVYNCVWSLLVALDHHNRAFDSSGSGTRIDRVLMTGLATGVGNVPLERCAQQTALAIRDFMDASNNPKKWSSLEWDDAIQYAEDGRRTLYALD